MLVVATKGDGTSEVDEDGPVMQNFEERKHDFNG